MTPSSPSSILLIGVAGGSGSGKTTFARMLQAHLGEDFCTTLAQDSYYRDLSEQFDRDGGKVNFDHPDAIEFSLLARHLKDLKEGRSIDVPRYDFASHKRLLEVTYFDPRPVVIVDGILINTQEEVRTALDFSFFIDAGEEVRFQRRMYRDVRERGRTPEGVKSQLLNHVKPMHDLFVEPSKKFANRIISGEKSFGPIIEEVVYGIREGAPLEQWSRP
ncbi:MAG TPA: uridine kinase [Bdellovibrionales bacterium]|nr:uridine kinase [Pseudobdellovibrionaceae bacterium]HAG91783.1 uridine kinase [Bdellovibrionales bacterium]